MDYDLDDQEVREMVAFNHVPVESYDTYDTLAIRCEQCKAYWPCPARVKLRQWLKEREGQGHHPNATVDDDGHEQCNVCSDEVLYFKEGWVCSVSCPCYKQSRGGKIDG